MILLENEEKDYVKKMYSDNYDRFGNGDDRLTGRRGNYRGRFHCRNSFLLSGFLSRTGLR